MTLVKGTVRPLGMAVVLMATAVGAAAGPSHPNIAAGEGCVTGQCHARLLEAAAGSRGGSVHAPAAAGDCASCHDLALPSGSRFVKGAPSGSADGPAAARAWDLVFCSECHGEGLLAVNAPAPAVGFADGNRNLHALHVQAGRGRRCLPCHDPHASRQAKLLRERIPTRGKAKIAQEFRGEPQGGWCKTGCHAPKSYTR